MDHNLKAGLKHTISMKVEHNQTASYYNSGILEVFATPAMIALMENAATFCVQPYLEEGFTTVGIEVNVKHLKASAVGSNVRAEAELTKIDGKRLYFNVAAYDDKNKIGEGTHVRYIVNSKEFIGRL